MADLPIPAGPLSQRTSPGNGSGVAGPLDDLVGDLGHGEPGRVDARLAGQ
jgi:hypothetical protein